MGASNGKIYLMKSVKSFYVIQGIFTFLPEKDKLKMLIYNKRLQEKFRINIENYKTVSGKYIIWEGDGGKGKEYDYKGRLKFKGEYSKGKKNGKGEEYDDEGRLIFEGKYKKGQRNGKGKEYDDEGRVIFEGEYLNGNRNGKGKEYYWDGTLKFEGEYFYGYRIKGKEYNYNGRIILSLEKDGKAKGII